MVVAHSRLDLAGDCVRSLRRWLGREDIVVVLNVPSTVDQSDVKALSAKARVVSPPAPQGYSANINFGVRELGKTSELLLLANDDVVFAGESLPRLVDCIRDSPQTGAVGARLVDADGREAASFSRFPTLVDLVDASIALPGPLWRRREPHRAPWEAKAGERGFPVGAVLLVRRAAFVDVQGFDEDFFLNWEEADFAFRMLERGWDVGTCSGATVTHLQGSSISRDANFSSFYISERLYFRKRLGAFRWGLVELLLAALFLVGVAYDAGVSLARPRQAHGRLTAARQRWRSRVFLRGGGG